MAVGNVSHETYAPRRTGVQASEWTFSTPPFLKAAGMEGRRALFFSCLYYALRNPHGFLPYSTEGEHKTGDFARDNESGCGCDWIRVS
eukprot:2073614-Rhodomonas_salina.2